MRSGRVHRRGFLGAAGAVGLTILGHSASVWGAPANAKLNIAMTEFKMLGNVATQFQGVLEYDPLAGKILNNPAADKALGSEYRPGWTL